MKMLSESSTTPLVYADGVFEVTLITPGAGSSGVYTAEMLAEHGPRAFPARTKMFFNHPKEWESGADRDLRDQWGYLIEDAYPAEDGKLKGRAKVLKHWREVVESLAEEGQAPVSIHAAGDVSEDGIVTALHPHRMNSVDLVAYEGRPGSAVTKKMYESARAAASEQTPDAASAQVHQEEEGSMKEALEAIAALDAKFTAFVAESKAVADRAAAAEASAEAIDEAAKAAVEAYDAKIEAIQAVEGLLPSQVKSLREAAREGRDVAPLIEDAKALRDEFKALNESASGDPVIRGRIVESADGAHDFTIRGGN